MSAPVDVRAMLHTELTARWFALARTRRFAPLFYVPTQDEVTRRAANPWLSADPSIPYRERRVCATHEMHAEFEEIGRELDRRGIGMFQ